MYDSIFFLIGLSFGAVGTWFYYTYKIEHLVKKLELLYKDLEITLSEWQKSLSLRSS